MLIMRDGRTVGAISGGCLERDVVECAQRMLALSDAKAHIVEYDTRADEDIVWGLGLGCNGVVQVLLETLDDESAGARLMRFIEESLNARRRGVAATVVSANLHASAEFPANQVVYIGERFLFSEDEVSSHDSLQTSHSLLTASRAEASLHDNLSSSSDNFLSSSFGGLSIEQLRVDARGVIKRRRAETRSYETASGSVEIFYDLIAPPRALFIFGAETDALPVVEAATALGWRVTVVDTRARAASRERFKRADDVRLCCAEDASALEGLDEDAAAVLMTHNFLDDVALLRRLLSSSARYVGALGPKRRTEKMLEDLRAEGFVPTKRQLARLHAPVGLDIGAETPEEIALSIVGEIKAAFAGRAGGYLRERDAPIHDTVNAPPRVGSQDNATLLSEISTLATAAETSPNGERVSA